MSRKLAQMCVCVCTVYNMKYVLLFGDPRGEYKTVCVCTQWKDALPF